MIYRKVVILIKRQRRGMSIAQGVSPGMAAVKVMNPLFPWERAWVREILTAVSPCAGR